MKTFITIVRHGETEWNIIMRLQGKSDSPLTKLGWQQARRVSESLKDREFDVFYSSDLQRAINTAKEINKNQNINVQIDEGLRERNFGIMEGLNREEIIAKYPETYHHYMDRTEDFEVPEGESLIQFSKRVNECLKKIVERHIGKRILIVSHGGVLDCMIRHVFDYPLSSRRCFSIYNSGINTFSYEEGLWTLNEWGNVDHLNGIVTKSEWN